MKIEFHLEGKNALTWFASALPAYTAAVEADQEENRLRWGKGMACASAGAPTPLAEEAAPVEAEKPKATRGKKAETKAAEEPAAQITTNPEDRKPVDVIEDAVIVEETAPADKPLATRADMQDAMRAYQARMGMEATMANMPGLLGAPKQSLVAEDPAVFEAVIARINAALEADPNG